jgi:hypothetical protein
VSEWNDTLPILLPGIVPTADDWDQILGVLHALSDPRGAYTPSWHGSTSDPVLGDGTRSGWGMRIGALGIADIAITIGSTTTLGVGTYSFSLPAGWTLANSGAVLGLAMMRDDSGSTHALGAVAASGSTAVEVRVHGADLASNSVPFAWATSDQIRLLVLAELSP